MERSKFFDAFIKQTKQEQTRVKNRNGKEFYFLINKDSKGFYVKTVNKNLKKVKIDSFKYTGYLKTLIDLYNSKISELKTVVEWDNPGFNIYLDRSQDIMDLLVLQNNLIDNNGNPLYISNATHRITLSIDNYENYFNCIICVNNRKVDQIISDKYILHENRIYSVETLGSEFKRLPELNASIKKDELLAYLSVVMSNFINIDIKYMGYKLKESGECELLPSLIIESIDQFGYMILKTTYSYGNTITPDFFRKYGPTKLVTLNEEQNYLEIYDLILPETDVFENLLKFLMFIEREYLLKDSFNITEDSILINPDMANLLFTSEIKEFLNNFSIFGDKILKKYKLRKTEPNLELLFTSRIDYLEGSADLILGDDRIPLFQAIKSFDEKGFIPLVNGTKGIINKKYIDTVRKVIHLGKNGVEVSFFDLPFIQEELKGSIKGSSFKDNLERYRNSRIEENKLSLKGFKGELRPYQKDGVQWLLNLHKIGISGCLADDMGLGKTVQTIAFILQVLEERNNEPILIVLPKTLLFNWEKEINKFSNLKSYTYYGNSRNFDNFNNCDIVLTTYHTLRNDIEGFREKQFFYTILDEIQNIKNHKSQMAKSCFMIKSRYKIGISGTPVENSLSDLYSVSRFLNPTLFGTYKNFRDKWSGPIASEDSEIITSILKSKISPLFLRRLKEDVLADLPPKSEQVIYIDMSDEQKSLYESVRKDYHNKIRLQIRDKGIDMSQFTIIKAFMELRQIASIPELKSNGILDSPKMEYCIEHLMETLSYGHKVVIFSNFLGVIKGIGKSLDELNIGYRVITGATNRREEVVEEFSENKDVKVLIMTLKTGGVGLNLTVASYVYIFDPWWNIASENQAIDRTHRIGQQKPVFCYRFISRGSIEEKILELQSRKRELFDNLFTISRDSISSFTSQDIDYLLG